MSKKKVLIITYYWPPDGGAGVQRWLKFVKYLPKEEYDIAVYTPENSESPNKDESLLNDVPTKIKVIKKSIWEPFSYYKKISKNKGSFNAGFLNENKDQKKRFTEKLSLFVRANFFVPDAKMFWIKPSVKYLSNYIAKNNIELIISSGPPHSMHIIALKLKKRTSVKWLADFRDPWTNIDFYKELPTLKIIDAAQKRLEKKTIQTADKIIVVSPQIKKEFLKISSHKNISVITNGFDTIVNNKTEFEREFTITHVGSINADRSHPSFYKAIHLLLTENDEFKKKLKIRFVGKVDFKARKLIQEYTLEDYCEFIPFKPYNELSLIQNRSHILYLPINNSPNSKGILTGKFFEYLAAKRYILAQGPVVGDLACILKETNAGDIFSFKDTQSIKVKITELFDDYLSGIYDYNSRKIELYSREYLAKNLDKSIVECLKQ